MPDPRAATVLIVDDERDILTSLEFLIKSEVPDVRVLAAASGPEALKVLRREHVDLIVSDYRMPGMDGFQFLEEARNLAPGIPSVMMTAYPDPNLAARAVSELGVGLFIAKPFDLDYFVGVVRSLVGLGKPAPKVPTR
jgi:CheY-like chemotaxis protein